MMRPILVKDIPFLYALLYAVKRTFAIRLVLRALEAGECLSAVKFVHDVFVGSRCRKTDNNDQDCGD